MDFDGCGGRTESRFLAAICALAVLLRLPLFFGDFLDFDDGILIVDNPIVGRPSLANIGLILSENFRGENQNPMHVANLLNVWLGLDYPGFVAVNLLWLVGTLVVLHRFVGLYVGQSTIRLGVVLAFAVHAVHLDTLAWMSARCHWMGLPFALGTAVLWRRWRTTGDFGAFLLAFASAWFAVYCKPIFISAPLFCLADDVITRRRLSWRMGLEHLPFVGWLAWRFSQQPFSNGVDAIDSYPTPPGLTPLAVNTARLQMFGEYLVATLLPQPTSVSARGLSGSTPWGDGGVGLLMHALPPAATVGLLCAAAVGLGALARVHRGPLVWAGVALLFVGPTLTPRPHPPGAEFGFRYALFPTVAALLAVGVAIGLVAPRLPGWGRRVGAALVGLWMLCHAGGTLAMSVSWSSGWHWEQCVLAFPASEVCLGRALSRHIRKDRWTEANALIDHWEGLRARHPALERGVVLEEERARIARERGRPKIERSHLERALELDWLPPTNRRNIRKRLQEFDSPVPPPP